MLEEHLKNRENVEEKKNTKREYEKFKDKIKSTKR
jgi:hypothetical protein